MAVALAVTGWIFLTGATLGGYVLGAVLTLVPVINVTVSHFCVLSWLYRLLFDYERGSEINYEQNNKNIHRTERGLQ